MDKPHPSLINFKQKIAQCTMSLEAEGAFDKWRNKCPAGGELKAAADKLWAEYQSNGGLSGCKLTSKPSGGQSMGRGVAYRGTGSTQQRAPTRNETDNASGADPSCLGEAFHNPYTFVPFPPKDWLQGPRARRQPTPLSMDEVEADRFTGVVELEIKTLSPLLTCHPDPIATDDRTKHKIYRALTSGNDVIVPATGVRGSLRNLMSILAGSTLGYLDENAWLVQGRDLKLGPKGQSSPPSVPEKCFLAEVLRPGSEKRDGKLRFGTTRLISLEDLELLARRQNTRLQRPESGRPISHLWMDEAITSLSARQDSSHPWKLKLSGRPIMSRGKREGLFLANGPEVTISSALWAAFLDRHRHGDHPELKPGDLVWLEPKNPGTSAITCEQDIESIQWARWGRRGELLMDLIKTHHAHMLPDCMNKDGLVDEVTDLFGQVPMADKAAGPFAARIRPDNLVFLDAASAGLIQHVPLAPLAPPHPGCSAFYRANRNADTVANKGPLRGFKVYRLTAERGNQAPWIFSTQGVYNEHGGIGPDQQKMNKTCDLLAEGQVGILRLACRSLSKRELALLLLACSVDWRLGGGKPLGLGHCRPTRIIVRDEHGQELCQMIRTGDEPAPLPTPYAETITDLHERLMLWQAVQKPVARLRYPRATSSNHHRIQRGGHVWFQRHAAPHKGGRDAEPAGLQVLWTTGELQAKAGGLNHIRAQVLPAFNPDQPQADVLYGYDLYVGEGDEWIQPSANRQNHHNKLEPFDPAKHANGQEMSGGAQGQNHDRRQAGRQDARGRT